MNLENPLFMFDSARLLVASEQKIYCQCVGDEQEVILGGGEVQEKLKPSSTLPFLQMPRDT